MQTKITRIDREKPELLEIHCHAISDEIREIIAFVKSREGHLTATADDRLYEIAVTDIFYNVTHTFDKNEKRFNKKFIAENFGKEEDDRVEQFIKDTYNLRKKKKR